MELQTISQMARHFNISTRTLRYYEQLGLIQPYKEESTGYRSYDEQAAARLQQIVVLRKLRIPLKQIADILRNGDVALAITAFEQNLAEVNDEISALSTIKSVIQTLLTRLHLHGDMLHLLDDESLLDIVDSLTASKINFKEDKTMEDLNKASEQLNKLTDKQVRIINLPPCTVASIQFECDEPERHCNEVLDPFVRDSKLVEVFPATRHFGFNAPNPMDETGAHGYEMWVTIPDDFDVPSPLMKKHFEGGLYAAHMIPFGAFEEWGWLSDWVQNNPKYEGNSGNKGYECMWGLLEEHLNYTNHVLTGDTEPEGMQLDLLHPIKPKA